MDDGSLLADEEMARPMKHQAALLLDRLGRHEPHVGSRDRPANSRQDGWLVEGFRHPGGNITGISDLAGELAPKRLSLLKEVSPSIRKVAILWNGEDRTMGQRYRLYRPDPWI